MKLKSNVIITVIVVISFLLSGGRTGVKAQGIFSTDSKTTTKYTKSDGTGTLQRDFGDGSDGDPGDGGGFGDGGDGDGKTDEPGVDEPIGEGLLILSILSGGYAIVKRNVKRDHEDY